MILVIDGQGGGMGKALIERLRAGKVADEIVAVGTNSAATAALKKAGADAVATGENAVLYNCRRADLIAGGIGLICANAMMGEISPAMAQAVTESGAVKILIPHSKSRIKIAGATEQPLPAKIDAAVREILSHIAENAHRLDFPSR